MVNTRASVLLQTASGVVADNQEKRSTQVRILLDNGSQRTYISEEVVKKSYNPEVPTKRPLIRSETKTGRLSS